jgi:nucleoside 2-deoxyribosyltransferase
MARNQRNRRKRPLKRLVIFGPLFTQAERLWNRALKAAIETARDAEYEVILPQDRAERFIHGKEIDADGIAQDCFDRAVSADLAVAVLDGADSDSGTCIEVAWRKGRRPKAPVIGVRTDFRKSEDNGLNLMLRRGKAVRMCDSIIDFPSFNESVDQLAAQIVAEARKLVSKNRSRSIRWKTSRRSSR